MAAEQSPIETYRVTVASNRRTTLVKWRCTTCGSRSARDFYTDADARTAGKRHANTHRPRPTA